MDEFFASQATQWLDAAPRGSAEMLNATGLEDFQIMNFSGRLASATELDVSPPEGSILFLLNHEGKGEWSIGAKSVGLRPSTLTFVQPTADHRTGYLRYSGLHRFLALCFSQSYLVRLVGVQAGTLTPPVHNALFGEKIPRERPAPVPEQMSDGTKAFAQALACPPIVSAASQLWFHSKAMEFIATHCFAQKENGTEPVFFCSQQKRVAHERIAKAKQYLREHLDEPLKLEAVAIAAGTSPHYLSRTFSSETGLTLGRYLRSLRIEKAAEILLTGKMNISEAAIEVGYRSQSHFARAFEIEKGLNPSKYLASLQGS